MCDLLAMERGWHADSKRQFNFGKPEASQGCPAEYRRRGNPVDSGEMKPTTSTQRQLTTGVTCKYFKHPRANLLERKPKNVVTIQRPLPRHNPLPSHNEHTYREVDSHGADTITQGCCDEATVDKKGESARLSIFSITQFKDSRKRTYLGSSSRSSRCFSTTLVSQFDKDLPSLRASFLARANISSRIVIEVCTVDGASF